ncbi:MAG: NAD(P)/FAD-dependent oxidoreductase [Opitutaceae bacterium]|nr:NAD(P)/FAD-dependent oxidoreductase [Opitutaceae bacterium]
MERYDVAIIGAGMSGIAAGIRLAHFGKKVCIFERHYASGGLNSFYAKDGRKYDVGLHAMTNFTGPGDRRAPLNRIIRQLRISREDLKLCEQNGSRVAFPGANLRFNNDFAYFESEIESVFPKQIDGFQKLVAAIRSFDDNEFNYVYRSAREVVRSCVNDPVLEDMIFCPLMYYGSSTEEDMDFGQFVIMFKSIFFEGFARPLEGIRNIIRLLLKRYRESGGIRKMNTGVAKIVAVDNQVDRLILDNGEEVQADVVLSSAGLPETYALCEPQPELETPVSPGRLAFTETISIFKDQPESFGWGDDTIVFFNSRERFSYREASDPVDLTSGVICIPNNFQFGDEQMPEGVVRVTCLSNYAKWKGYGEEEYAESKEQWRPRIWEAAKVFMPPTALDYDQACIAHDMFTPTTVERYTWRKQGAIYGAPQKTKDGTTPISNLFICGTDQGFLGIVGSMLSGIAMANTHALR